MWGGRGLVCGLWYVVCLCVCVVCLWYVCGVCLVCVYGVVCVRVVCVWCVYGVCLSGDVKTEKWGALILLFSSFLSLHLSGVDTNPGGQMGPAHTERV